MPENKTQPTGADVAAYLAAIDDPARRADCEALVRMMGEASGCPATMWGPAIVGFGTRRYPLAGGREGEICRIGFSPRKGDISLYLGAGGPDAAPLLARLGRHKLGKGCLYVRTLADVDRDVLRELVDRAFERPG